MLGVASVIPLGIAATLFIAIVFDPRDNAEQLPLIAGLAAPAIALAITAAMLWKLRSGLGTVVDHRKAALFCLESMLAAAGYVLASLQAGVPTPDRSATNGPFADGLDGGISLVVIVCEAGLVVAALIVWEAGAALAVRVRRS